MDSALIERADAAIGRALELVDIEKRGAALFGSLAGKGSMADALIRLFPQHKVYTEVFVGGGAVFWTKPKDASETEVINDLDPDVAFAFRFAQKITDDQIKALERKNWIASKELFRKLRDSKPSNDLDRFHRFIYLRKVSFGRSMRSFDKWKDGKHAAASLFKRLPIFKERLGGVRIFSGDYLKPLKEFDGPNTVHFMDPPYRGGWVGGIGEGKFDEEGFFKTVSGLKGKAVVTYDHRPELTKELRQGFNVKVWRSTTGLGHSRTGDHDFKSKPQIIVTNFVAKGLVQVPAGWEEIEKASKPLSSPGGKDRWVPDLLPRIPKHKTYVEPYAGSASLFWAKEASEREILSDINADIINVFRFLQGASDADLQWLRDQDWTKSKSTFEKLKGTKPSGKREQTYRTKYLTMYSRRSDCVTFNTAEYAGSKTGQGFISGLERFRDRLKGVELLTDDAIAVIGKYDGPETFFYVDPPWKMLSGLRSRDEWRGFDAGPLVQKLQALKGKALISYQGDFELGKAWSKTTITRSQFGSNQTSKQDLYWNYQSKHATEKAMTDAQREDLERESALINENRKKPEASKSHDFKAAKWTHPNGHPRCLVCGGEETMSGICNTSLKTEERVSQRFNELQNAEPNFDVMRDWDRLLERARREVLGSKKTAKIQIPIEPGDERLAAAVTRLAGAIGLQTDREERISMETPEADRFVSGELDLLAMPRKGLPVGKSIDLVKDGEVIGSAELGKPDQVDLWRFAELTARHGINEEARKERWPQAKKLFTYPVKKAEPKDPGYVEIELSDAEANAISDARKLAELWHDSLDGFVRRQAMFLEAIEGEESKRTLAFVRSLPDLAGQLMAALKEITGSTTKAERAESAVVIGRELLKALKTIAPRLPASKSKDVIDRAVTALTELDRLSREEFLREGGHIPQDKRETAPVFPSGEKSGKEIDLNELLPLFKPAVLRRSAVTLVGGIVNWGKSRNDVDVLIKGPLDPGLRRVIEFRLGRMMPGNVSQRMQFLDDDELGGPFTDHVELFDLWLVPRTHQVTEGGGSFEKIEMRDVAKADDPLMDLPRKRGKRPAAYQYHFRGRSLHADLRIQVNDQLVGWTLANAKAGKVPAVTEVKEARRLARRFDRDGSFFEKDWTAPEGLFASPKGRMPRAWLELDGEKFEPGEIGATAKEPGVIVKVTGSDLRAEYGIQKSWAHEYFFTGDPKFSGRLFFRQLTGRGEEATGEEAGRRTPRGETFWRSFWTKDLLPSVLNRRSVKRGTMPPDGYSALPLSLEASIPAEFRYWEAKGAKAREMRDALVEAKILTPDNIRIVDGEFRKVTTKTFLDLGNSYQPAVKRDFVRYGLAWQFWKGQQVVRAGPSRQVWHLVVERGDGKFDAWKLSTDPLSGEERISGTHRVIDDPALLTFNGEVKPGQKVGGEVLNSSKATRSWVRNLDNGKAELIETSDGIRRLRFRDKLRGIYALSREEEGSDFWLMELEQAATKGRSAGASIFAKHAGRLQYIECPACAAINLRLNGIRKLDDGNTVESVECNECSALFGVRNEVIDRNTLDDPSDDLDDAPADDGDYLVIKAVPVRDGIQVWDPIRKDDSADRTKLRPPAIYRAMKSAKSFDTVDDILERFATPAVLELGIMVEPRYEGDRLSLQKRASRVMVLKGDQDVSQSMPNLVKELREMAGDFVLDGVTDGDRVLVFDSLYADGTNVTDKRQAERRRKVEQIATGERILAAPVKVARTRAELIDSLMWAYRERGSVGAVLKGIDATYSLSGDSDLWASLSIPAGIEPDPVSALIVGALAKEVPLIKTEEERFVLGIVLEPNDGAGGAPLDPDSQKDIYSDNEIRQAAHRFMEDYRNLGVMHAELANDRIKILESYLCPANVTIGGQKVRKGTWLLAVRIVDDTLWQRVKRGELTGFSIGGSAMRHPVKQ